MSEHLLDAVSAAAASLKGTPRGAVSPSFDLDRLSPPGKEEEKKTVLQSLVSNFGRFREADGKALLADLLARRRVRLDAVSAARFDLRTVTPLTLHLSRAGVLENAGICLHRVYGFPVLPGTGLKGMARAYAESLAGASVADIARVFGHEGKGDDLADAGELVFHDAWPTEWPKLIVDIANNHHRKYYAGTDAPGDWEEPNPVSFLALAPGASFSFALSKRSADVTDASVALAEQWLRGALVHLGAGAKTAAGYGWFADAKAPAKGHPSRLEYTLELVTPAFLAGAEQKAEDCTLRSATVKGLLRWWWRTMHAGHVTHEQLLAMESVIFGSTTTGQSMVDVVVVGRGSSTPQPVPYSDGKNIIRDWARQKKLAWLGPVLPLRWLGYGMADGGKRRQVLEPGARFSLTLTHRKGASVEWKQRKLVHADKTSKRPIALPTEVIRAQVEAALWLFIRYGGVGGRSRKGFGSLSASGGASPPDDLLRECRERAQHLRRLLECDDSYSETRSDGACSIDAIAGEERVELDTSDPWMALNEAGLAVLRVIEIHRDDPQRSRERAALGLPRRGVVNMGNDRHAAPVHLSFERTARGTYAIRLLAFASSPLPREADGKRFLKEHVRLIVENLPKVSPAVGVAAQAAGRSAPSSPSSPSTPLPAAREERWHPVTVTLNPGSGELSTGFQGQRASVRGEAARKIREALDPASQERLTKKRELKNVAVRVRVDGNQRDLVAIEIAS
ncbi:MAG: type III-B CRISPR module RAMP protein Cmr6 [Polyangiales bacterium]